MTNRRYCRRTSAPGALYHVTQHSAALTKAFATKANRSEYLARIANYLSPRELRDSSRHLYTKLHDEVSVLTYCLLDDHLHLLLRDLTGTGMTRLMHRVNTGFVAYFNRCHDRRGPLFDAPFAAKPIADDDHLRATVAYIHLNEIVEQLDYEFCGHKAFMGEASVDWLSAGDALEFFGNADGYVRYMDRAGPAVIRRKLEQTGEYPHRHRYRQIRRPR